MGAKTCALWDTAPGGCWGGSKANGYRRLLVAKVDGQAGGALSLHRFACWLAWGNPPSGAKDNARHTCQSRCFRPACLRWGTAKDNKQDRMEAVASRERVTR